LADDLFRDTSEKEPFQTAMTMCAHNDQIAMTLHGNPHNAAGGISFGDQVFDRRPRSDRRGCALKVFPQAIAITFRFKLLFDLAKGDIARPERFRDMSNDEQRSELGRQVSGNLKRALRAMRKVGGVQDDRRSKHHAFSEKDQQG
jgi:hypothetical protein